MCKGEKKKDVASDWRVEKERKRKFLSSFHHKFWNWTSVWEKRVKPAADEQYVTHSIWLFFFIREQNM